MNHICQSQHSALPNMRALYSKLGMLPTSENADVVLIRSHIAYWSGGSVAERANIKPSRGHSYRVRYLSHNLFVRIRDYYDHREGVTGWVQS